MVASWAMAIREGLDKSALPSAVLFDPLQHSAAKQFDDVLQNIITEIDAAASNAANSLPLIGDSWQLQQASSASKHKSQLQQCTPDPQQHYQQEMQKIVMDDEARLLVWQLQLVGPLTAVFIRARSQILSASSSRTVAARCCAANAPKELLELLCCTVPPPSSVHINSLVPELLIALAECAFMSIHAGEEGWSAAKAKEITDTAWAGLRAIAHTFGRAPPRAAVLLLVATLCSFRCDENGEDLPLILWPELVSPPLAGTATDWYLLHALPMIARSSDPAQQPCFSKALSAVCSTRVFTRLVFTTELRCLGSIQPVAQLVQQILAATLHTFTSTAHGEFWRMLGSLQQIGSFAEGLAVFRDYWSEVPEGWEHLHRTIMERVIAAARPAEAVAALHAAYVPFVTALPLPLEELVRLVQKDVMAAVPPLAPHGGQPLLHRHILSDLVLRTTHSHRESQRHSVALMSALLSNTDGNGPLLDALEAELGAAIKPLVTSVVVTALRSGDPASVVSASELVEQHRSQVFEADVVIAAAEAYTSVVSRGSGVNDACAAASLCSVIAFMAADPHSLSVPAHVLADHTAELRCHFPSSVDDIASIAPWLTCCAITATIDSVIFNDDRALTAAVCRVLSVLETVIARTQFQCELVGGQRVDALATVTLDFLHHVAVRYPHLLVETPMAGSGAGAGACVRTALFPLLELLFFASRLGIVERAAGLVIHCIQSCPNAGLHAVRVSTMAERRVKFARVMQHRLARSAHADVTVCRLRALEAIARFDPPLYSFLITSITPHNSSDSSVGQSQLRAHELHLGIVKEIVLGSSSTDLERAAAVALLTAAQDTSLEVRRELMIVLPCAGAPGITSTPAVEALLVASALRYVCGVAAARDSFPDDACFSSGSGDKSEAAGLVCRAGAFLDSLKSRISILSDRYAIATHDSSSTADGLVLKRKLIPLLAGTSCFAIEGAGETANILLSAIEAAFHCARALEAFFLIVGHFVGRDDSRAISTVSASFAEIHAAMNALWGVAAVTGIHAGFAFVQPMRLMFVQVLHGLSAGAAVARAGSPLQLGSGGGVSVVAPQATVLRLMRGAYVDDSAAVIAGLRAIAPSRCLSLDIQRELGDVVAHSLKRHAMCDGVWAAALETAERHSAGFTSAAAIEIAGTCWDRVVQTLERIGPLDEVTRDVVALDESVTFICAMLGQVPGLDQHVSSDVLHIVAQVGAKADAASTTVADGVSRWHAWHAVWCSLLRLVVSLLTFGANRWSGVVSDVFDRCERVRIAVADPIKQDKRGWIYAHDLIESARCLSIVALCHTQRCLLPSLLQPIRKGFVVLLNYRMDRIRNGIVDAVTHLSSSTVDVSAEMEGGTWRDSEHLCVPMARDCIAAFLECSVDGSCGASSGNRVIELDEKSAIITFSTMRDFVLQQLGVLSRLQLRESNSGQGRQRSPGSGTDSPRSPSLRMSVDRESIMADSDTDTRSEAKDHHIMALQGALLLYTEWVRYYSQQTLSGRQQSALADAKEQLTSTMARVSRAAPSHASENSITSFLKSIQLELEGIEV